MTARYLALSCNGVRRGPGQERRSPRRTRPAPRALPRLPRSSRRTPHRPRAAALSRACATPALPARTRL